MLKKTLFVTTAAFALTLSAPSSHIGFGPSPVVAQENERPTKPRTRKVQTLSKETFEALNDAQGLISGEDAEGNVVQIDQVRARQVLDRAIAREGINEYEQAMIWQIYAFLYAEQEDYAGATVAYENAIRVSNPAEGLGLPAAQITNLKYNLGQLYMVQERYQEAVNILLEWQQEAESVQPYGLILIANAYFQLEQYQTAIPVVIQAIDMEPEPKEQWYQLLLAAYLELEDYPKGGDLLEVMVGLFPTVDTYFTQLAAIYGELRRDDEAFAMWQLAYKQGFLDDERTLVRLARLLMFNDTPIEAAQVMEKGFADGLIERTDENLELLANAYFNSREYEKAIPPLTEAANASDEGELSIRLGQAHLQSDNWRLSETALEQGIDKGELDDPGNAWMLLGIAEFNGGKVSEAIGSFQRAMEFEDSRENAERWLRFVQSQPDI